eukprot:998354-Amphidinium_carterae.1
MPLIQVYPSTLESAIFSDVAHFRTSLSKSSLTSKYGGFNRSGGGGVRTKYPNRAIGTVLPQQLAQHC